MYSDCVPKGKFKVTNYFYLVEANSTYINLFNNNEQSVKLVEISDNIKIVNINLAAKAKVLSDINGEIIKLPSQVRPSKNLVFTAYVNREPAFAYYTNGGVTLVYNKAINTNSEIDIIANYVI